MLGKVEVEWEFYDDYFGQAKVFEKGLDQNSLIFLNVGSFGDVFSCCTLFEQVSKYHQKKVIVIVDKKWELLAARFSSENVSYILISDEQVLKVSLMSEGKNYRFMPGKIYPTLPTMHPLLPDFLYWQIASDYQLYKVILHIPPTSQLFVPALSFSRLTEIRNQILSTGVRLGRTCILSFQANTISSLSTDLISHLVSVLLSYDIDVLLNSAHTFSIDEYVIKELEHIPRIKVPPDCPMEFVELAGAHCGSMMGLNAILISSRTNAMLSAVADFTHPTIKIVGRDVPVEHFGSFLSYRKNEINPSNDYVEFIYNKNLNFSLFSNEFSEWCRRFASLQLST